MSKSGKKGPEPAYPSVPATPSCPPYPIQQGPGMAPQGAPPPYSPAVPTGHQAYPQQPYYAGQAVPQAPAPQAYYAPQAQPQYAPPANYNPGYPVNPNQVQQPMGYAPVATAVFDAGARFNNGASPSIPPPPPGCAPNAAQLAAMQGGTVVATQRKSNFWTDGSGGGSTFW